MGKNKEERRQAHSKYEQRHAATKTARTGDDIKAHVPVAVSFLLAADQSEVTARTMLSIGVIRNIDLGRIEPSKNQAAQIVRAAREMGWEAPSVYRA